MSTYHFLAVLSVVIALLCLTVDASAQGVPVTKMGKWNGEFSINAGSNLERQNEDLRETNPFFTSMNGGVSAKIGYKSGKFYINGTVNGVSDNKNTTRQGFTGDLKLGTQDSDTVISNIEFTDALTKSLKLSGGLNAGWKFGVSDRLDVSYKFVMDSDTPEKTVRSIFAHIKVDYDIDTSDMDIKGYIFTMESSVNRRSGHNLAAKYFHDFVKPGRCLEVAVNADIGFAENNTDYGHLDISRSTVRLDQNRHSNLYQDDAVNLLVKYTDRKFLDVKGLDADFFFRMDFKADIDDLSKENYVDSVTVTTENENYHNHEYKPSPGFHLTYSAPKLSADVTYSPQFFFYSIFNSSNSGELKSGATSHFIDIKGSYKPWSGHSFDLVYKRDVSRPDYLQLSPIERIGSSSNEKIVGNPELKPAARNKLSILYNYGHGRFSSTLETGVMHEKRKIGQLISYCEDGTRIRSWHNADDGYTANTKLSLFWKGSDIKADLSANLNYFYGKKDNGDDVRTSDWSCRGSVSYLLKTWIFNVALNYQSKIIRQYSSRTEIIGLDMKVEKQFGRLGVFVEGRNLLDRNVVVMTESDDGMSARYEDVDNNNRLILLGLKYKF